LKERAALYLIFGFGVLWHSIDDTRSIAVGLTPWALLLSYFIILYPEIKQKNMYLIIWVASVYLITFIIEVIGVETWMIFGEYNYGATLGLKAADVPLVIGMNWTLIILGAAELSSKLKMHILPKAILAGLAAAALDFLIEPVAVSLNYWQWSGGAIPLQNYIAWFVIGFLFSLSYLLLKIKSKTDLPVHFFAAQVVFFGLLNLTGL
jgi:bisanhydrobacterioruberin hydratase